MMATSQVLHDQPGGNRLDRVSILVLVAAGLGALGILAVRFRDATTLSQLAYNEGWNAYHALRFLQTGSPYPPSGGLMMNNYTPIWFPLVAWAGALTGSLVFAGRLVATGGFVLVLVAATMIGRTLRGSVGAFAALVTVTFVLAAEAHPYIGIADPQFLAQGIGAIALLFAVRASSARDPKYLCAMALSVFAGFVKYNLAALPFALIVAAMFEGRPAFVRVILVAVGATVFGYVLCALIGGVSWPTHLLSARVYSGSRLYSKSIAFVTANAMGLLIAFAGLRTLPKGQVQRVLSVYIVAALPLAIFFVGGEGVASNIFFDTLIPMAIAGSLLVGARPSVRGVGPGETWSFTAPRWGSSVVLGSFLLVIGVPQLFETTFRVRHSEIFNGRAQKFQEDIQFVKSIPGNAICYDLDLCYLAGKPQIYDPFNATQALETGAISAERARALLVADSVQVIHTSVEPVKAWGIPEPIAAEVAAEFEVARKNENGVFYVRRNRPGTP